MATRKRSRTDWGELNELLWRRCAGHCERCGMPVLEIHRHHRQLRSQGGKDLVVNLVMLCASCHGYVHGHPAEAYADGFMVHSYATPETTPVRLAAFGMVTLRSDGWFDLWIGG